ncbi:MAG: hypothetical protein ACRDT8_26285 [Micromonosporaceae bacterium]
MTLLEELAANTETAREAIASATDLTQVAQHLAQEKAQQAAGLGAHGVAATILGVCHQFEAITASLSTARGAVEQAVSGLAEITHGMGTDEVVARLDPGICQLAQVAAAVDAATGNAHQAVEHARQADIDSLTASATSVLDALSGAWRTVDEARSAAEAYRQRIDALAKG